jgi:hypothetical protein
MASQIKSLTKAVALLTKSLANKENMPSNRPTGRDCQARQYTKPRSMGCYCWSHGFYLAGVNHTSTTCKWKKRAMMPQPLGQIELADASFGHHPSG